MKFNIRPVESKDEDALRDILYRADPSADHHPAPHLIWERWGRYYFDHCRSHCFAAERESDGRVLGVILCSPMTNASMREFNRNYFPSLLPALDKVEKVSPTAFEASGLSYYRIPEGKEFLRHHPVKGRLIHMKYPAHLHINVHPDAQRQGLGHLLMDRLITHLTELGVPGLHLIVASDNRKGIGFYERYGFKALLDISPPGEGGIVYGLNLKTLENNGCSEA